MSEKSILLISNNKALSEQLVAKIVMLRKSDNIIVSDYFNALDNSIGDVVLLHETPEKSRTLELINRIKIRNPDTTVFLLTDSHNQSFILEAYDSGISDFCSVDAPGYEIVIKIINTIKMASARLNAQRYFRLLTRAGIIDEESGFYSYKTRKEVLETAPDGVFIALAMEKKLKPDVIHKVFKNSLRNDDIVVHGKTARQYLLLLPGSGLEGAQKAAEKILADAAGNAGIARTEKAAANALSKARIEGKKYLVEEKPDGEDWLDEDNKQYKIFRQIFDKRLENVIAPVFYRMQKEHEGVRTRIMQIADENQCVFLVKSIYRPDGSEQTSKLEIIYPGFAKVLIRMAHEGLDSPENSEISVALSQLNQKFLENVIEDFIDEIKPSMT